VAEDGEQVLVGSVEAQQHVDEAGDEALEIVAALEDRPRLGGAGEQRAIEDGAVLSRCLDGTDRAGVAAALRRYEKNRQERTAKIQLTSRQNIWGKGVTDTDWVYGYNAWEAPLL